MVCGVNTPASAAPMAGLPGSSGAVGVGPPLLPSAARLAPTLSRSPDAALKPLLPAVLSIRL